MAELFAVQKPIDKIPWNRNLFVYICIKTAMLANVRGNTTGPVVISIYYSWGIALMAGKNSRTFSNKDIASSIFNKITCIFYREKCISLWICIIP